MPDFVNIAKGCSDSLKRLEMMELESPDEKKHVELCRKEVASEPLGSDDIQVNLNENLYNRHEERIFSEGANFNEPIYIHLKIRDLRIEMSLDDFEKLHEAVTEAKKNMGVSVGV
jgi:hypothetical protein